MDLLNHGEPAYPADAWVEQQYMQLGTGPFSLVSPFSFLISFFYYLAVPLHQTE